MKKLKQNASFLTKILLVVGLLISNLSMCFQTAPLECMVFTRASGITNGIFVLPETTL